MTLGLAVDPADASASVRLVEVALDAAGAGGSRTYTYRVPPGLDDLVPGRGRPRRVRAAAGARDHPRRDGRLAGGRAEGDRGPDPRGWTAPAAARSDDGPLDRRPLPRAAGPRPAGDAAARPARAAGARRRTDARPAPTSTGLDPADLDLVEQLSGGARPVRDLAGPDGRAGLLRRLRRLAERGTRGPRLDARRCRWRAPVRTLAPPHARWPDRVGGPRCGEQASGSAAGTATGGGPGGPARGPAGRPVGCRTSSRRMAGRG